MDLDLWGLQVLLGSEKFGEQDRVSKDLERVSGGILICEHALIESFEESAAYLG